MVTKREKTHEERLQEMKRYAALLVRAINEHQGEWYTIVDGELFHGRDRESVRVLLAERGTDPNSAPIDLMTPPMPTNHRV